MNRHKLNQQRYQILLALAGADLHGSDIVRKVLDQTDGSLRLWPATLYGSLELLCEQGWIQELVAPERPTGQSEKRRYYRITSFGKAVLREETERMARLVEAARQTLSGETS